MKPDRHRAPFFQQLQQGLYAAAADTLAAWIVKTPGAFEPRLHQIQLDFVCGHYRRAHAGAAHLTVDRDCPPEWALEAIDCLKSFALHDALIDFARHYPHRMMMSARSLSQAAISLSGIGAHDLALEWVELAVRKAPADPLSLVHRALILGYLGTFDRARADLECVLAGPRRVAMAFWMRARLDRQTDRVNHVAEIRHALDSGGLIGAERAFLCHALFKELDDLGEYAAAWAALEDGNRAARIGRRYDRASEEQVFNAIKRAFPSEIVTRGSDPTAIETVPIFIVGLHRSGTSLIERILGAAENVHDLGETDRFAVAMRYGADRVSERVPDVAMLSAQDGIDYALVRKTFDAAARKQSRGKRFVTEKTPANFLNIGAIGRALPHARILHMRRDPRDLCFANFRELFGERVVHTSDLADLVHYHHHYQDLMSHWHRTCPGFILDVDYEKLVARPAEESRRVFEFCGLAWREDLIDRAQQRTEPVSTLSSIQVRQPVNTRSIGRWRAYAPWLQVLIQAFPDSDLEPAD